MSRTTKHVVIAISYFLLFPFLAFYLFAEPGHMLEIQTAKVVGLWLLGVVVVFASWVWKDAQVHNVSRFIATLSILGWLMIFVLSPIAYFFVSRGRTRGAIATGWFLLLCVSSIVAVFILMGISNAISNAISSASIVRP